MPNRFDAEKKKRIAAAGKLLADGPEGKTLASVLLSCSSSTAPARTSSNTTAKALAAIARDAYDFFRRRKKPTAVRVADIEGTDAKGRSHTAIELSTLNRPFIFDSVLGELQALGHSVRLVVHPIFDVERDAAGEVLSFAPMSREPATNTRRESFVHVHVPLDSRPGRQDGARPEHDVALERDPACDRRLERHARKAAPCDQRSRQAIRRCRTRS